MTLPTLELPPIPPVPDVGSAASDWDNYIRIVSLHRGRSMDDELAQRRIEAAAAREREVAAMEVSARTARTAMYAGLVSDAAARLLADRTTSASTDLFRAQQIDKSVADAILIVDRALAAVPQTLLG